MAARVLDAVRDGGCLSGASLAHVDACESCRGAIEQARRVAEVWTGMKPSDRELQRARARFFAARASRRKARMAPASLALAVLLVAAVASAAVRVGMKYLHVDSLRDPGARASAHVGSGPGSAMDSVAVATAAEVPAPSAEVTPAPPTREATSTPGHARPSEARAHKPAPVAEPRAATTERAPSPSPAETAQAWAAAAEAMRTADYPRAEAAFADLTRASDAHTRDAARLARAQVWLAQGRVTEARPELEDLAANGATTGLRSRAAAAIERLR